MPTTLLQTLRSRWFAITVHAGLWLLVYLVLTHLGGKPPDFRETRFVAAPATSTPPSFDRLVTLFSPAEWPKPLSVTNGPDPFMTRYFVPPPTPAPPPPPTSRKIEVTYLGFYQTADNPQDAIVKVADSFVIARVGRPIETNLFVAQAKMQSLLLTNLAAQTNLVLLNVKKQIEVPIR